MDIQEKLLEQIIVLKAQLGDGHAYTQLIQRYHYRLLYYIRRLADDQATVEDIAQNVWFAVFRQLPALRDPEAFPAWIFRIARNQAAQRIRHLQRERDALDEMPTPEGSEEPFEFPNDVDLIHSALNRLKPQHCEVLVLFYIEDLSYEEIAYITKQKLGTVRSRIHYAKQALKQAMEDLRHEFG